MKSKVFVGWLEIVYLPEAKSIAPEGYPGPFILIVDGHTSHTTFKVVTFCDANQTILICLATHSTHLCQSCDKTLFGSMKKLWKFKVVTFQNVEKKTVND